ncbi:MAG: hypothetical protein LBR34_11610, partial [Prevotella sp.]|nr:hypothetical protein [Prevotella sp.]
MKHGCAPTIESLSIAPAAVYAEMGYRHGQQPDEEVVSLTESLLEEIAGFLSPSYFFRLYAGKADSENVHLDEGATLPVGTILAPLMQGADCFALFAATAGKELQNYQEELKKEGDILKSYVADAIGSCIAENTGNGMERMLEKEIPGLRHTSR